MGVDLISGHLYRYAPADWTAVFPSGGASLPAASESVPAPKGKKSVEVVRAPKAKKSVNGVPAPKAKQSVEIVPAPKEEQNVEDETAPSASDSVSAEPSAATAATPADKDSSSIDDLLESVLESTNRPNP